MKILVRPCLSLFVLLMLTTGIAYPLLVTGLARTFFPHQAAGSLIVQDDRVVGSSLIGQSFTEPKYFWGRPSATSPMPYNAANSGGSNQGPTNPALIDAVKARIATLRAADPSNTAPIPVDLVSASASGLDPDISRAAADYQTQRVARARRLPFDVVQTLVARHTRDGWIDRALGEGRVNVLALNLALDELAKARPVAAPGR